MKVVVCGSFGDLETFNQVLSYWQQLYGRDNVFPDHIHLERSRTCIDAHHHGKGETFQTLELRAELMHRYFEEIEKADLVVFVNEKNGNEHYGIGSTLELGYAFAKQKKTVFLREPTDSNIRSLRLSEKLRFPIEKIDGQVRLGK